MFIFKKKRAIFKLCLFLDEVNVLAHQPVQINLTGMSMRQQWVLQPSLSKSILLMLISLLFYCFLYKISINHRMKGHMI